MRWVGTIRMIRGHALRRRFYRAAPAARLLRCLSVSVASAVKRSQRLRQTGRAAAKRQGRPQPRFLAPHQDWLLGRLEQEQDLTMRALVLELGERGIVTSEVSVWRLVRDAKLSFKKNAVRRRTGSSGRGPQAPVLEEVPGQAGA